MKKYLVILRQSLFQFLTYRLQIFLQVTQSFITPLILLAVLSFPKSLVIYYILVALTYPLVISTIDEDIDNLSLNGDINNFLLKPIPLFRYLLTKNIGEKLSMALPIIPFITITLIYNPPSSILAFIFSLPLAFILSFCFSYFIGLFCFWYDEFWPIHNLKFVLIQLLSGVAVPLYFFPTWSLSILKYTPFPYLAGWTARITQNNYSYLDFIFATTWIIVLYGGCVLLEKSAINKYSYTAS